MYIPQLSYPGTWIDGPDREAAFTTRILLGSLETSLVDAALSLEMFESAEVDMGAAIRKRPEDFSFSTQRHRLPFIHARSFVLALHDVQKFIRVLCQLSDGSSEVEAAMTEFASKLPDLKAVRDSEQHLEERLQGLVKGKKLPTSLLWIGNLINNTYQMTMADGRIGNVEVSRATLDVAASCIQRTIDSFQWTGLPTVTDIR